MSIIEILCFTLVLIDMMFMSDFVLYTRAHRYDVYERQIGSYIPYRKKRWPI